MDRHIAKKAGQVDAYVGSRVRLQRVILGMSQGALAAKLGVTFQQVQKYEKGTNRIGASRLQAIAQALGVPIGYFFDSGAAELPAVDIDTQQYLSAEGIRLNRAFLAIDDGRIRRRLIELVRSIADAESSLH